MAAFRGLSASLDLEQVQEFIRGGYPDRLQVFCRSAGWMQVFIVRGKRRGRKGEQ